MALREKVGDAVAAGFATAAGEDDAFSGCCGGHCGKEGWRKCGIVFRKGGGNEVVDVDGRSKMTPVE